MTDRELLELLVQKVTEHGEILQALRHSSEIQKAQFDQLQITVAHIEGRQEEMNERLEQMDKSIDRMAGDISFLVRKSAEHDDDIRELRRAK